jgi:hypothetical protein
MDVDIVEDSEHVHGNGCGLGHGHGHGHENRYKQRHVDMNPEDEYGWTLR